MSLNSLDPAEYENIMGVKFLRTYANIYRLIDIMSRTPNNLKAELSIVLKKSNIPMYEKMVAEFGEYMEVRTIKLGKWVGHDEIYDGEKKQIYQGGYICTDLMQQVCILSNGDYALCCFDAEGIIGANVLDTPIVEAFNLPKYIEIRKHQALYGPTNPECLGCSFNG